jgi:predicted amidophosphoribosyltransferase
MAGAIRELKFHAMRAHGERLGALLGETLAAGLREMGVRGGEAAIVPIPMTPWRRIARGVDHATTIARSAARVAGVPLVRALWRRHRPTQWSVPTSERRRNVSGSIGVRKGWWGGSGGTRGVIERLKTCRVVVVLDDVRTTGATMTEACRVLDRALAASRPQSSPIIIASTVAVANIRSRR